MYLLPAYRPAEDLPRDAKTSTDVSHNSAAVTTSGHGPAKAVPPPPSASSAASSNAVLSSFLYGMPMSSKPHPDGKLDFKAMSFLSLGKDRGGGWTAANDKMAVKECAAGGELQAVLLLLQASESWSGGKHNMFSCLFQRRAELASTLRVLLAFTSPRGSSSPSCTKNQVSQTKAWFLDSIRPTPGCSLSFLFPAQNHEGPVKLAEK